MRRTTSNRLLQIAPAMPARSGNGLAMRIGQFTEALARLGPTEVVVIANCEAAMPPEIDASVHILRPGPGSSIIRLIGKMAERAERARRIRDHGRPSSTAIVSDPIIRALGEIIGRFQPALVMVNRARLLPALQAVSMLDHRPLIFVDLDDDDAALLREQANLARANGESDTALLLDAEADTFDDMIAAAIGQVDHFIGSTEKVANDLCRRLSLANCLVVRNGVELAERFPAREKTPRLLFVGNLSYFPNIDGICWFLDVVWPKLHGILPGLELIVAGSDPPEHLVQTCVAAGVTLVANPPQLAGFYAQASAAIAPLRLGSGGRIKICEAGAFGVPVISTAKGAEGLGLDATHIYLSPDNKPESLLQQCVACLSDPAEARQRAGRLHDFVTEKHDRSKLVADLAECLGALLAGKSAAGLADQLRQAGA